MASHICAPESFILSKAQRVLNLRIKHFLPFFSWFFSEFHSDHGCVLSNFDLEGGLLGNKQMAGGITWEITSISTLKIVLPYK